MSFNLGNREEFENHILAARGLIDSFPAWRRFWEEEASTGSFTTGFTAAIDSASSIHDFSSIAESKSE